MGAGGFEPPKSSTTDLQSAPFGHSGTLPYAIIWLPSQREGGAGRRTRTPDLLITNQLLYQLSYTSTVMTGNRTHYSRTRGFCQEQIFKNPKYFCLSRWQVAGPPQSAAAERPRQQPAGVTEAAAAAPPPRRRPCSGGSAPRRGPAPPAGHNTVPSRHARPAGGWQSR